MLREFYSKLYRIYLTMSKLYTANHFKPLSQLKLLGEFAKIWFGKNFPVALRVSLYTDACEFTLTHDIQIH